MTRKTSRLGSRRVIASAALLTLPWAAAAQAADDEHMIETGKQIVEAYCSPCHAVGLSGDSPHTAAPRFRDLQDRYPVESIEEALVEGISTGHPAMPEFEFDPDDAAAIIAYLRSLSPD